MLDALLKPLFDICNAIIFIWNGIASIINLILGILTNPIGFIKWVSLGGIDFFINFLPSMPENLSLNYAVNSIAESAGIPPGLVAELGGMASQFLLIAAVIKIYKLIPFKAT